MAKKIAVIGDVMLDMYDYCANRDNPESSAPCYTVEKTEYKPGGAGNVAFNLHTLGSEINLIGVVGEDPIGGDLKIVLSKLGIPHRLIVDPNRRTILKERTMAVSDGRYHYRKDRETKRYIEESHVSEMLANINEYNLILVSDYNKGTISERLMERLKSLGIPILVDPKPNHKNFYFGVFMITPNVKEVREMTKLEDVVAASEALARDLNTRVLLTKSEEGISYFGLPQDEDIRFDFPAEAKKVFDVTGAGDTVIATFAHFFNRGYLLKEAARLANRAAGIAVAYPGCYAVSEREILEN